GPVGPGVIVGVDPVDNGVGDLLGHVGQQHEHVVELLAGLVDLHHGIEVDPAVLVFDAGEERRAAPDGIVHVGGGNDAAADLEARRVAAAQGDALEDPGVVVGVAAEGTAEGVGGGQQGGGAGDAGGGRGAGLGGAVGLVGGLVLGGHHLGVLVRRQR